MTLGGVVDLQRPSHSTRLHIIHSYIYSMLFFFLLFPRDELFSLRQNTLAGDIRHPSCARTHANDFFKTSADVVKGVDLGETRVLSRVST